MVSFFRRKKPDTTAVTPARGLDVEALAAAFPNAPSHAGPATTGHDAAAAIEQARDDGAQVEADVPPVADAAAPLHDDDAPAPAPPAGLAVGRAGVPADGLTIATFAGEAMPFVAPADQADAEDARGPTFVPDAPDVAGSGDLGGLTSPSAAPAAPAGKTGWRERLRGSVFSRSLGSLFSRNPKLDEDLLDEIETALLTADVGVAATTQLVDSMRRRMKARDFVDANALLAALRAEMIALLVPVARPLVIDAAAKPFVILTVGVNGVGKTTTIGKLAKRFKDDGHAVMLAAGDTFRAAAVSQLQTWGARNGVAVIAQGQDADAASVAFDALQAAKARGIDVLIADTAGRLHTQQGLMAELGKIGRVLGKLDATAPHEVLMVVDGTTGQNAVSQVRQFRAAANVTGLVVTKLDGTAKGGVVFALAREFGLPIRFAGIGERPEDLRVFDAEAFVDALLPEALGA